MRDALIVVDVQKDFCTGGALACHDTDAVIEPINALIKDYDRANRLVIFSRDWHPADHCSFEEQLPDALSVIARSLKAGMPFSESLNMVSSEMHEPINKEFAQVFNELNYGGDLRSALLGLLARMPIVAVMAVVTAVLIQRETGGNLAEVLERIASLLRERFRFQRSVRTLSAEGRGTAWVVSVMPFILAAISEIMKPGWISGLVNDPMGKPLTIGAFILMVFGIIWLKRLVNIDV